MPEAAVIAWGVFFVVCVAWRFWHQRRTTADSGLRGVSGRPGSVEWWGGMLIVLSFSTLFVVPALEVAGLLTRSHAPRWKVVVGLVTMSLGIAITLAAQIAMGPSWRVGVRPGERTPLVTTGIFGIVRNPIFSGVILAAAGAAVLVPRPLMAVAALGSLVGVELQVRRAEEPHLRDVHGANYAAYTARVGRFLPGLGRRR